MQRMKAAYSKSLPKRVFSFWPYAMMTASLVGLAYSFWVNYR
jgi:hypothetical protein